MVKLFVVGIVCMRTKIIGFKVIDLYSSGAKIISYASMHKILESSGIVGNLQLNADNKIEPYPSYYKLEEYTKYDKDGAALESEKAVVLGISYNVTKMSNSEYYFVQDSTNGMTKRILYYSKGSVSTTYITDSGKLQVIDKFLKDEKVVNCRVIGGDIDYTDKFIEIAKDKLKKYLAKIRLMQSVSLDIEMDKFGGISLVKGEIDILNLNFGTSILHESFKEVRCNKLLIGGGIEVISRIGSIDVKEVILMDGVREILTASFYKCGAEKIKLPDTLKTIRQSSFSNCTHLVSLEFPSDLNSIKAHVCQRCQRLETVKINNSSTVIDTKAFIGCIKLRYIIFDKNIDDTTFHEYEEAIEKLKKSLGIPRDVQLIKD